MSKQNQSVGPAFDPIDIVIPSTDELDPTVRPPELGETYKEQEADAASAEQLPLAEAQGESEALASDVRAASSAVRAKSARRQLRQAGRSAKRIQRLYDRACFWVALHSDRPTHSKAIYWGRLTGLVVGDVAACSGAILLLGETTFNAVGQASSAAVAAVTLGAIGSDVKRMRQARAYAAAANSTKDGAPEFNAVFTGKNAGDRIVQFVALAAGMGMLCIAVGVFSLRGSTEGSAAAWTFGLFSAAIGLASFINSYTTTCAFGEYLDRLKVEVDRARAWLETCRTNPLIGEHAGAVATSKGRRQIWAARGLAAWWARQREKFAILNDNPRIVGNGLGSGQRPAAVSETSPEEIDTPDAA